MSMAIIALAVVLLSLALFSIALAALTGRYSVRGGRRRSGALAVLGIAALAGMTFFLWGRGWSSVLDDILWPLAIYSLAVLSGVGAGVFLLYGLVGAR
jgi:hypothetical protein